MIFNPLSSLTLRTPTMPTSLSAVALLFFAHHVLAHEHHGEDILEGEAVSAEPIVCFQR